MTDLVRTSVSLEKPLYEKLEKLVAESGYDNRSEFLRDLVRERLIAEEWERDRVVVGALTLIYSHHTRNLTDKLTDLQHHQHHLVLAAVHVHLDEEICIETILLKGRAGDLKRLADKLRRLKGVLHAALSLGSTAKHLA